MRKAIKLILNEINQGMNMGITILHGLPNPKNNDLAKLATQTRQKTIEIGTNETPPAISQISNVSIGQTNVQTTTLKPAMTAIPKKPHVANRLASLVKPLLNTPSILIIPPF